MTELNLDFPEHSKPEHTRPENASGPHSAEGSSSEDSGHTLSAANMLADLELQLSLVSEDKARLENEKQELLRLAQSRQAEFENFRRRVERERTETVDMAAGEAVKALLPIVDDFSRAVAVHTADTTYAKGVELIHQRLGEIMAKLGLDAMDSCGQIFDPNLHYAIDKVESPDAEEGLILEEFQKGYRFRGKLLRPAMVKVAAKS